MKTILLSIICLAVLCSCGDSTLSQPESVQSTEYFPLHIGDTWKYAVVGMVWNDTLTATIKGTKTFNGKTYYEVSKSFVIRDVKPFLEYYRTENDKVYTYENSSDNLFIDFVNKDTSVGYVYSLSDNIITKIGTFNNVKNVQWRASAVDGAPYNAYSPNIGLISSYIEGPSYEIIYAKVGDKVYK